MTLAERAKQRRIELNLTQTEVADAAGVTQQTIEALENDKTKKPKNILSIAKALKCDPEWLMYGRGNVTPALMGARQIPLLSYLQAGSYREHMPITAYDGKFEFVITDMDWSPFTFALKINGDAMEPEFKDGDVVIIDPEIVPRPGEFVVAKNGSQEATFKKYRPTGIDTHTGLEKFELVPLNQDYPILKSDETQLIIIGTMVEHRIYRRKR